MCFIRGMYMITFSPGSVPVTDFEDGLYVYSFQSCLVGIVVPDPEVMPEWAKKKGLQGTYKDLCKNTVGDTLIQLTELYVLSPLSHLL